MGDVHESNVVGRTRRNSRKSSWLTADMIVAYALAVVEEAIPSTYRETEISSVEGCHGRRDEFSTKTILGN